MQFIGLALKAGWAVVAELLKNGLVSIAAFATRTWIDISAGFQKAMAAAVAAVQIMFIDLMIEWMKLQQTFTGRDMSVPIFAAGMLKAGPKSQYAEKRDKINAKAETDKQAVDMAAGIFRARNAADREAAEKQLETAIETRKAMRALGSLAMYGWLTPSMAKEPAAQQTPAASDNLASKKPLEALTGLEKGTLEAAKAAIEAQAANPLLKAANKQVSLLEEIATNTGQPPIEVDVVG